MLVGHPVVAGACALATYGMIYLCIQNMSWWPVALIVGLVASQVIRLADARAKYLSWKREWDAMDGSEPESARPKRERPVAGVVALAVVLLYCALNLDVPICRLALIWTIAVTSAVGLARLIIAGRRTSVKRTKATCVELCIRGPVLAVPTLPQAYRALPAHCQSLLRR